MTLFIHGASGKLGRLILDHARQQGQPAQPIQRSPTAAQDWASPTSWYSDFTTKLQQHAPNKTGILDVSVAEGTANLVTVLLEAQAQGITLPSFLIVGTTGHSADQTHLMEDLAKKIAVVLAPNFSRGVLLLQEMLQAKTRSGATVAELARALGFDIGLVELHHTLKKDAPSGTALALAKAADIEASKIASLRIGHVIGEHTLALSGHSEEIRISHLAGSRQLFAAGAVDLAQRLLRNPLPAGLYSMGEVI